MTKKQKMDEFAKIALGFATKNKQSICIMADMETNLVVMAYDKFVCAARNKGKLKTIKNLVELNPDITIRDQAINQFAQEIDGMCFAISEQMYNERNKGVDTEKSVKFTKHTKDEKGNTKEIVDLK